MVSGSTMCVLCIAIDGTSLFVACCRKIRLPQSWHVIFTVLFKVCGNILAARYIYFAIIGGFTTSCFFVCLLPQTAAAFEIDLCASTQLFD